MKGVAAVLVGLTIGLVGGVAGFFAGTVASSDPEPAAAPSRARTASGDPSDARPAAPARPSRDGPVPDDPETPRDLATLPYVGRDGGNAPPRGADAAEILDRLAEGRAVPEDRRREALRRAEKIRDVALRATERADAAAARLTLDDMDREDDLAADLARGGPAALLRSLLRAPAFAKDLARDAVRMDAHTSPAGGARAADRIVIDGTTGAGAIRARLAAAAGPATIAFPEGFHDLDTASAVGSGSLPADLVVSGAGMDRTILRAATFRATRDLRALVFRDVTIDCNGSPLVIARGAPATLRFERCRLLGFDGGGTVPVVVAADACIVLARECRFDAGFGRAPGTGAPMLTTATVARFEACTFAGPLAWIAEDGPGRTYELDRCRFERTTSTLLPGLTPAGAPEGVVVRGCTTADELPPGAGYLPPCGFLWSAAPSQGARALQTIVDRYAVAFALPHDRADWSFAFRDPPGMPVVEGVDLRSSRRLGDAIVRFGEGAFDLDLSASNDATVVVQGQSRDTTLLRIRSLPRTGTLVLRDVAIDCESRSLDSAALRTALMRVRFVRFDRGKSGTAVAADAGFLWMWDCRFDEGFGGRPGTGTCLALGDGAVSVIEQTTFELSGGVAIVSSQPARVHVRHCRITGHAAPAGEKGGFVGPGAEWIDTQFEAVPQDYRRPKDPRPLSEINPAWARRP